MTARTSTSARSTEALFNERKADCAEIPISTKSALLSTVVDSAQNGMKICRVTAPVIRGATWLMNSPQTTTASTPEAWMVSASRNAANGVTSIAMLSSIGSSIRPRTCQLISPTTMPASTPPTYASTSSQVTCQPVSCSSPTVTPTASP